MLNHIQWRLMRTLLALSGSLLPALSASAAPSTLVVTTAPVANLVEEVSCQTLRPEVLVPRGTDPHSFALTPNIRAKLEQATHLVRVAPGYEHWLKVDSGKKKTTLAILDARAGDPHFWNSPEETMRGARKLARFLEENALLDPSKAKECLSVFEKRAAAVVETLKSKIELLPADRRTIATTHDALGLFGKAFGLRVEPILGLSSEESPTPKRLRTMVSQLRARKIHALFVESTSSRKVAEAVARDSDVRVGGELIVDSLAQPGQPGDTIVGAWTHNVDTIVTALRP